MDHHMTITRSREDKEPALKITLMADGAYKCVCQSDARQLRCAAQRQVLQRVFNLNLSGGQGHRYSLTCREVKDIATALICVCQASNNREIKLEMTFSWNSKQSEVLPDHSFVVCRIKSTTMWKLLSLMPCLLLVAQVNGECAELLACENEISDGDFFEESGLVSYADEAAVLDAVCG
ncbi:hypothetical protein RRG08_055556 [Elysia crispata]|uniref:Uncharacterized protein n=1 Tax=Elysia crispata TaxID=231223 RepID=A0AAE1ADV8_9GAST|nr:hypothetical protein RRG08_055556 [Elysia crispata]